MPEIPHTLSDFEDGLNELRASIIRMASLANINLKNAVVGLVQRDEDLCNRALADDEAVNNLERAIDEKGMEILMRFNPVARDLRSVVTAMKIATHLERVSDNAENIARRARKIMKRPEMSETLLIEPIFQMTIGLLEDAIQSYSDGDVELALSLFDKDDRLDALHRKTIKRLTREMEANVENLRTHLHLIFIVRCLERVGDHAVNIGEDAVYLHRAADIRHVGPDALLKDS